MMTSSRSVSGSSPNTGKSRLASYALVALQTFGLISAVALSIIAYDLGTQHNDNLFLQGYGNPLFDTSCRLAVMAIGFSISLCLGIPKNGRRIFAYISIGVLCAIMFQSAVLIRSKPKSIGGLPENSLFSHDWIWQINLLFPLTIALSIVLTLIVRILNQRD